MTDILSELTRQLGPLERQSETARVYLKKKEELKILDVNMYQAESAHIKEQLKETEEKYQISQKELQQTQTQFDQTKQSMNVWKRNWKNWIRRFRKRELRRARMP